MRIWNNDNVSTNSTNFNSEENGIVEVSENEDFEHFWSLRRSKNGEIKTIDD